MTRFLRSFAVLSAAVTLSSCSLVPTDPAPRVIAPDQVPFSLLAPPTTVASSSVQHTSSVIWLIDAAGQLARASRFTGSLPEVLSVEKALIAGPTDIETLSGYATAVSPTLHVDHIERHGHSITLALSGALSKGGAVLQKACGQIVLTALGASAATSVRIVLNGVNFLIPNPRHAATYVSLASDFQAIVTR